MSKIDELLAKRKQEPAEPEHYDVDVTISDELVTLRFKRMTGTEWAELTAANPLRPGVLIDSQFGYNLHAACRDAAPLSGFVVEDGGEVELSEEQWEELLNGLSGRDFRYVFHAIWYLNELQPQNTIDALKKALTPASAKKRNSRAS